MRRTTRGLSFLELLVAMTVTFLAISFLMGLFVSATRNSNRSKTYSTAGFLAQGKMEVLNATPLDMVVTGSDNFTGNYADYVYNVDVEDAGDYDGDGSADPDLKMVTLTVRAPDAKTVATLVSLRATPSPYYGVIGAGNNPDLAFMGSANTCAMYVRGWDYGSGADPAALFPYASGTIQDLPNGGRPGAVASTADMKSLWAVDFVNNGLRYTDNTMGNWSSALLRPAGLGHPTGLAISGDGKMVWVGDDTNHCIWMYDDSTHLAGTWSGKITTAGLGRVLGVTCCNGGTDVYVVDADNNCVRQYVGTGAAGAWTAELIKNPDNSMSQLRGVAVTRGNTRLFVMDATTLQWADVGSFGGPWTSVPLPSKLEEDGPQGLSVSDDGKTVWAIASNGLLFRCDLSSFTVPGDDRWDELGP